MSTSVGLGGEVGVLLERNLQPHRAVAGHLQPDPVPVPVLVVGEQPGELAGLGSRDLRALLLRQQVARIAAVSHQRSSTASAESRSHSAPARLSACAYSASNCVRSSGANSANAARIAGPDARPWSSPLSSGKYHLPMRGLSTSANAPASGRWQINTVLSTQILHARIRETP